MNTTTSPLFIPPLSHPHTSPPPHLHTCPSQSKITNWMMAATMTTIHDDDDNEYDELPTNCRSAKRFVSDYLQKPFSNNRANEDT